MGIRYYAYPFAASQYEEAVKNPCQFHGSDPLMDAWGPRDEQPEMLYLDKCWNQLQVLLSPAEVAEIASDLATVGEADIRRALPQLNYWNETPEQIYSYVAQFLAQAQEFTTRLAADGRGLVYLIG